MQAARIIKSGGVTLLVALLTILLSSFLLFTLKRPGIMAFNGAGWPAHFFHLITRYLGYSVFFFVPVLCGYFLFFTLLKASLSRYESDPAEMENIRYYSGGLEICITLFFGIGVLFTAWGLQNALVSAIGGMDKTEAGSLGAWGILKRLVDNGILIALWTTIVGGIGGYSMRMAKHFFLGRKLAHCSNHEQEQGKRRFFQALESIRLHVERIEERMNQTP